MCSDVNDGSSVFNGARPERHDCQLTISAHISRPAIVHVISVTPTSVNRNAVVVIQAFTCELPT